MHPRSSGPSPYSLTEAGEGYGFVSDAGDTYSIYFSDGSGYFPGMAVAEHALMLGFTRLRAGEWPAYDSRIAATVMAVVERALLTDERRVITYVCDHADNRQKARHRLFARWFESHSEGRFVRKPLGESVGLYAALLFSKNNPFAQDLIENLPSLEDKMTSY